MTSIKQLPRAVYSALRSSVILFDLSRVVEELIYNSIDAGAAKVNVAISVGECYVKVEDDGCGITRDGLVLLGEKYATSKLNCFAEMDVASENFGFRGEALGSLSDISLLEVTTKARARPNAYRKIIKGCKCLFLGIDDNRQEMGTTVVVRDLFYNQPVRRKYMQTSPKKVLHSVKKCVLRVALVHPQVSFKVTDVESGDEVLCTHPSPSPLSLVSSGFGIDVSRSLCELNFSKGIWKLSGYISAPVDTCSMKEFQYVYINSRFVCKGPIHKLLNNLADSSKCLEMWKGASWFQNEKRNRTQVYAAYILNLRCPRSNYDLTFEPSKTMVEFKDWVPVLAFVEQAIRQFWRQMPAQGDPQGKVDEVSGEGAIWKHDDDILSPIQDVFIEDLSMGLEVTKKKLRIQHDQNFLHPSSFSLEMASEESDILLHPEKHRRPYEALHRNTMEVKEQGMIDYFHQTDYTSQDMSPSSWNAFSFKTTPVISRDHCMQFWPPHDDPLVVEDSILSSELTGRPTSEDDVNNNILGSRWGNDFLGVDATMNERSTERLTSSRYDHKNEVPFPPKCPKGLMKPFLRSCSSLRNRSSLGNVLANRQEFEIESDDMFRAQRKQHAPDHVMNAVGVNDSDQNLDFFRKTPLLDMFATSRHSSSVLRSPHTVTDLNERSTDFIDSHPTEEVRFTDEIDLFNNSPEQFGKSGSSFLSTDSSWRSVSPYSICGTVASKVDHFTDDYVPDGNYMSCNNASPSIFRDREMKDKVLICPNMVNSSSKEDPASSCTNIDIDYEYPGKYFCTSPFPGCQSNDLLNQRIISYNKASGESDWLCLDSPITDNANNCATPTTHIISPCYHENKNPREELDFQYRGHSFHKGRSRRSHSAPPFYKGKSKFSTIYNCATTAVEREPSSPNLQVTGDSKHLSQFCCVSQCHFEQSAAKDFPQYSRTPVKMMQYNTEYIDQVQEDFTSNEVEDLKLSGVKWRNRNQQTTLEHDRAKPHNLQEQNDILDIFSGFLHLAGGSVVPESISKHCLEDAKVLLQLDKKFIPVVAGVTLAVIDQHAADERIRLEELRHKVLSGEGKSVAYLDCEQELVLPEIGYQLLQNYAEQIQNWGWICNIHAQGSGSFTKNLNLLHRQTSVITLLAVPCILGVNLSDKDLLEFLEQLAETDGSSTLPPSVIRVLNFKACRGAIMFGDALLPSECSLIIEELKQTSLCFQCAHGRPTMVPLVNLKALHKQIAHLMNRNGGSDEPWHGLHQHRPSLKRARQRLISAGGECE